MADISPTSPDLFPPLPLNEWEASKETLHLFLQIAGKIRLTLMPRKNHWWHATLYVTTRGISTGPMPYQTRTVELRFDFTDHILEIVSSEGKTRQIPLYNGLTVGQFYQQVFDALRELGFEVKILAKPYDVKSKIPFAEDQEHHHYDPEKVHQFWVVISQVDQILKEFSGRFYGKTCPVQFYWHHFDLTVTRFSGKRAPVNPDASIVEKDAYSHEVISFGFWVGDELIPEPAFYSYAAPLPEGLAQEQLQPAAAAWEDYNGSPMAIFRYNKLRQEPDPKKALLDFLESAYQAGAKLAKWPVADLTVPPLNEL